MDDSRDDSANVSDAGLLSDLRSDDLKRRQRALRVLYPEREVALLECKGAEMRMACTSDAPNPGLFTTLLWATEQIGRRLGLQLGWLPSKEQQHKLVVPHGPLKLMS